MEHKYSITTISFSSQGLYKEKGSKFHAYAFPVKTDQQIREYLNQLKKEHPKARHHCYAYRLGSKELIEFVQDAGEPSGSAGLPILNALRSKNLHNSLVVVVRYFGGTKLGIPGLIHAYKQAAVEAIENNKIVSEALTREFEVQLPYENVDVLYKIIGKCNGKVLEQEINTISDFKISIPLKSVQTFIDSCSDPISIREINTA